MCCPLSPPLADRHGGLLAAVTEVAENSLFAYTEASDEAAFAAATSPDSDGTACLRAAVHFSGPVAGRFELAVPEGLARALCAAFAGAAASDEIGESDLVDFTGELANMICGTWLTRACRHESFSLTPPRVSRGGRDGATPPVADAEPLYLSINDGPVRLEVGWEDAGASGEERHDR